MMSFRFILCGMLVFNLAARAESPAPTTPGTVITSQRPFTPEYSAYAQVEPRQLVSIKAAATGVIANLNVLPGERVHAGQGLATLGGPDYLSELQTARAERDAAQRDFEITQANYPQFSSAQDVANAHAALETADAALVRLRAAGSIPAPVEGIVLSIDTAEGTRVAPGQTLFILQPSTQLWLRAVYYGDDALAVHPGMTGEFSGAHGGPPIPVKVATVFATLASNGGESVGLLATNSKPAWLNGEFGTVSLMGPTTQLIAVPTRALILDQGKWWVMVRTAQGPRAVEVVPGVTRGWQTFISRGLNPGADVIVENAYLEFHRSISKTYMPPD